MSCVKASELAVIKPGTKEWDNAVMSLRNAKGHGNNFRVNSQRDAKQLLEDALGKDKIPNNKPHTGSNNYGFEYHRSPEPSTRPFSNDLEHIKWYDWRSKSGADGHIFYELWN